MRSIKTLRLLSVIGLSAMMTMEMSAVETGSGMGVGIMGLKKKNTSYQVGQLYIGGHVGVAVPTSIGEDDGWTFKDAAKTGFVIYGDVMRQMNQAIGLGGEIGFRNYPYNDQKIHPNVNGESRRITGRASYEATYRGLDFDLTGRVFITTKAVRPFIGVFGGGEIVMNSVTYNPPPSYQKYTVTDCKTTNLSPLFGFMAGAYFKAGKRTLMSVQGRIAFVTSVKDGVISVYNDDYPQDKPEALHPIAHEKETNISITIGLHVGKDAKNQR